MQVLAFLDHFGIADDDPRVNPWGGAIAVGHPLASSGVRLMTQLSRQFAEHPDVRYGLTAMCVGIGMGGTVIWENPNWEGRRSDRAVFADEVVTAADGPVPAGARPGRRARADHPRQRPRPHPARPRSARAASRRSTPPSTRSPAAPPPPRRSRSPASRSSSPSARTSPASRRSPTPRRRARSPRPGTGSSAGSRTRRPDVRVRQRRGDGRRPGAGAALPLPDDLDRRAGVALPEVFLGLVPGWGGTQLLPNLIGIDPAVTVIVENALTQNKMLTRPEGGEARHRRRRCSSRPTSSSGRWSGRPAWSAATSPSRGPRSTARAWDAALARATAIVAGRTRNASPGAVRAVELLDLARAGADGDAFAAGTAAEDEALADLIMSDELRAGLYSVRPGEQAGQAAGRRAGQGRWPARSPRSASSAPGLMASQLALLFVRRLEVPVVLTDLDQARVDKGVGYVHGEIEKLAAARPADPGHANQLKGLVTGSLSKDAFADADLVIEAVFEELSVKQQVFAEVEEIVSPECVLATNTSSLSVTEMAVEAGAPRAGRRLPLLQPGRGAAAAGDRRAEQTDDATLATAFAVGKALKKSLRAGHRRPGVRGQPAAHPLPRRGHRRRSSRARRWPWPTARSTRWACR